MANQNPWLILAQAEAEPAEGEGLEAAETAEEQAIVEIGDTPRADEAVAAEPGGFLSTEVLMLIALVLLIALTFKPFRSALIGMLDSRAARIRHDLDEAQRLREEAQAQHAAIQRRQREALKEAEEIITHAHQEAERLRERTLADVEQALVRREKAAMDRIAQAEQAAMAEVRGLAVDVAVAAARQLIAEQLADDPKTGTALVKGAIDDLPKRLN